MKVLAFGASNSRISINQQLAIWAANELENAEVNALDLNDFEMPLYSSDRESENGIPKEALDFIGIVKEADGIVISLAEHNGTYTAAFKNLFDWASRLESSVWANKPMLLLSTSPGPRGAVTVMEAALTRFPRHGGEIAGHFSLPSFGKNFNSEDGITNEENELLFRNELEKFIKALTEVPV